MHLMKDNLNTFQKHYHVLSGHISSFTGTFAFAGISMRVAFIISWIRYALMG